MGLQPFPYADEADALAERLFGTAMLLRVGARLLFAFSYLLETLSVLAIALVVSSVFYRVFAGYPPTADTRWLHMFLSETVSPVANATTRDTGREWAPPCSTLYVATESVTDSAIRFEQMAARTRVLVVRIEPPASGSDTVNPNQLEDNYRQLQIITENPPAMPIELDTHDPAEPVAVQPGTNEADALCFLYANPDYGFRPAEVRDHTTIPNKSTHKALTRLLEKDLIGKTADGYYHALDDQHVARFADSLRKGESFDVDVGTDEYPDDIDETTTGFPAADAAGEALVVDGDEHAGKEPFPDDPDGDDDGPT